MSNGSWQQDPQQLERGGSVKDRSSPFGAGASRSGRWRIGGTQGTSSSAASLGLDVITGEVVPEGVEGCGWG
jgi:hypothetical protein